VTAGLEQRATEDRFTPPGDWCQHPEYWHSDDAQATEHEVSYLVSAFVRALQPEIVLETGSNSGQTAEAIGWALKQNGHGHLYSLEVDPRMAVMASERCHDYPVTVLTQDSLSWTPPGDIGFAWLDSEPGIRHLELLRYRRWFVPGAVVGVHDTGPQHVTGRFLWPLIEQGVFNAITLRTPRGVTFGTVTRQEN
jgi:predicted O-methyltransferase YrrM